MSTHVSRLSAPDRKRAALSKPSSFARAQNEVSRRYRQFCNILKTEGRHGIARRLQRAWGERLLAGREVFPVLTSDVLHADLAQPFRPFVPPVVEGQPITVNWVTTPAGPGSGGHTTLFRIINYLQDQGWTNRIYFYDVYGGDHAYYALATRDYYHFQGEIAGMGETLKDAHAVVATAWPTAYPVFNSRCAGQRFYFIQDFEPYFHPVGTLSLLAENTYRMGFQGITIGACFAEKLRTEFGMSIRSFDFGADTSLYHRLPEAERSGVVFYAKRANARRGLELGLMTLELFARRHPTIPIHIYGDKMGPLAFAYTDHGKVSPAELNRIYNRCYTGLSLSFTNPSLVVNEMLAAGCIPVVNDSSQMRVDAKSSFLRSTSPHPHALVAELEAVVRTANFDSLSRLASASVQSWNWRQAGAAVESAILNALKSHSPASTNSVF